MIYKYNYKIFIKWYNQEDFSEIIVLSLKLMRNRDKARQII